MRRHAQEQLTKGQLPEALTTATTAVQLDPQSAAGHAIRAVVLSRLHRQDESVGEFREATQLEPGNARHHFNLASQLNAMGRKPEALSAAEEAYRLDPTLPNLAQLLQQLRSAPQQQWDALKQPEAPAQQQWDPVKPATTPPSQSSIPPLVDNRAAWGPPAEANTSGQGKEAILPYGVGKWNWGAFALTSVWALCMRLYALAAVAIVLHVLPFIVMAAAMAQILPEIMAARGSASQQTVISHMGTGITILSTVSRFAFLAGIVLSIWLGISGSGLAWRARRFQSIGDFQDVQKAWNTWGIVAFCVYILSICCIPAIFIALGAAAISGGMSK